MPGRFRLTYKTSESSGTFECEGESTTIGRHPKSTVAIPDESVSRHHATIVGDEEGWEIHDSGSRNGIYINLQKADRVRLRDRDLIILGRVELTFEVLEYPAGAMESGIEYVESPGEPRISQSIDVSDYRTLLQAPSKTPTTSAAPATVGTWAVPLFSRAAEALLTSTSLDAMLNTVLDLVFENLPAERGCIFLNDDKTGDRTLRVMRKKSGHQNERFTVSMTVVNQAVEENRAVLVSDSTTDEAFKGSESIVLNQIRSILCAPLFYDEKVTGVIYLDTQSFHRAFSIEHLEVLTTLALLSAVAVQQAQLRERVQTEREMRGRLERYSAPSVVERIVNTEETDIKVAMLADEREATILFVDLCDFTTIAEALSPREVTAVLNSVFEQLTDCVFNSEGTLDKFTGDGLMAIFGAPLDQPDHALRGVRAALEMQRSLPLVPEAREHNMRMRIGVNTGLIIAGDIGSPRRKDYTVIGDAVNVASRLESYVASPGEIVIGPRTKELIDETGQSHDFELEYVGDMTIKGKERTVDAFKVIAKEVALDETRE